MHDLAREHNAFVLFVLLAGTLFAQYPGEPKTETVEVAKNQFVTKKYCAASTTKCECSKEQSQYTEDNPQDGCVQMVVAMGRPRYSALTDAIALQLNELEPTSRLYSPDGFCVVAGYTVSRVTREKNAGGVPKWVRIITKEGVPSEFVFEDGESVGRPLPGMHAQAKARLAMVDAQGWATAADPAYYDYYPGDGSRWRFGAAPGASDYLQFVEHQTPVGRMETKQDIGLEIVRDGDGVLRQVVTPTRLADLVVRGQDSYDLAIYPNDASCLSGARTAAGVYEIVSGAVPEVVWKFRNPTPGVYGVLEVTREKTGADPQTWRYQYVDAVKDFTLTYPGGLVSEHSERLESDDGNSMVVRKYKADAEGVAVSKGEQYYEMLAGSYVIVKSARDPDGLKLTRRYEYYKDAPWTGLDRLSVFEDSSWTRYEYDDSCRVTAEIRPWLDAPTNAPNNQCAVTRFNYTVFAPGDFLAYNDQRPRTEIKEICGIEVARTYHAYPTNALGQAQEIEERAAFPGAPYGHASTPRTVKTCYAANAALPLPGRLATVVYPGGKTETYGYEYGIFNAFTFVFTPDPEGGAWRETVTTSYGANSGVQSLRSARVWDEKGREVLDESYVEDGAAFARIGWTRMSYDRNGKLVETTYSDGRVVSATWGANCCGKESETSAEGIVTVYGYNALKQKVSETKKGLAADGSDDITTLITYDLENRILSTAVTNVASGLGYIETRNAYDAVGRLTNVFDRLGNPTVTTYAADGTVTITRPNGVVAATERYLDGKTKRVLENGAVKQSYAYGVTPGCTRWTLLAQGDLPAAIQQTLELPKFSSLAFLDFPWQLQSTDPLNRSVAAHKPGFNGAVLVTSNAYDIANNLLSSTQYASSSSPDNLVILSRTLYSYAADGSRRFNTLDLNTNGVTDLFGRDRVTGFSSAYEKDASNLWWRVSRTWVYSEFSSTIVVTNSVQRTLITGLGVPAAQLLASNSSLLILFAERIDVRGNISVAGTLVDRAAKKVTWLSLSPTSVQPSVHMRVNGLSICDVAVTSVTNTYGYDALGRHVAITDGRGNTKVTSYNKFGQVAFNEDGASNRTTYAYDELGRSIEVMDGLGNVTRTQYDAEGRITKIYGSSYPIEYGYDTQGRIVSMKTFRNDDGAGDATRWLYETPTGLLTNKLYADGKGPSYSYTPDGKLASRAWARGIQTSYSYDSVGSLTSVDYSDNTPDISFTYDRLGKKVSVTDASGIRSLSYACDGQLQTVAVQLQNEKFTLHESYDTFGRSSCYALSNVVGGASSLIAGTMQSYDAFGRISEVSVAGVPGLFRYGWFSGSDLQQFLSMPNGVTRQATYNPRRDLLASISQTNEAGTILARRTFDYDAVGRLFNRTQYRLGDETDRIDSFGYNSRSELTSVTLGTNTFIYTFDPIGNRLTAAESGFTATYDANALNQYTNISTRVNNVNPAEFIPVFDLDGNQTLLRTSTGIWHVTYNAENRPLVFSNDTMVVAMDYDYMGRRFAYKETVNGIITRHESYLYRGYLQITALDLLNASNSHPQFIRSLAWDPTEPSATRPLCLQISNDQQEISFVFSFDQVKNVTELFDVNGGVVSTYDYAPFGLVSATSGVDVNINPLKFSSEVEDVMLGLVYYNWRNYNVADGRWLTRDKIGEKGGANLYSYAENNAVTHNDYLGLWVGTGEVDGNSGYIYCNPVTCKMDVGNTENNPLFPADCARAHEESHIGDVLPSAGCKRDACGKCDKGGLVPDSNDFGGLDKLFESECKAYVRTIECCLKKAGIDINGEAPNRPVKIGDYRKGVLCARAARDISTTPGREIERKFGKVCPHAPVIDKIPQ